MAALIRWLSIASLVALTGCGGWGRSDGAPSRALDPNRIEDAVPHRDPITSAGNKNPYTVLGKTYRLLPSAKGYRARGVASWYGTKFHGESTANGERYDLYSMTAAHCTLPIPTYVQVTNLENGKQCIVRVNDRGPFEGGRLIDLSYAAATKLGYAHKGTAMVEVTAIDMDNWPPRNMAQEPPPKLLAPLAPVALPLPATPPPNETVSAGGAANSATQSAVNTAPAPSAVGGTTYVQVAAFSTNQAAEGLRTRLANTLNYRITVQPTSTSPVLYRVRIGPFNNATEAEQARDQLHAQQIDGARIIEEATPPR